MKNNEDEEILEAMVRILVANPESVRVVKSQDDMGVLLTLDVAPEDMGKVIGREGKTASALRTLMRSYGMRLGKRVAIKITEPEGSTRYAKHTELDSAQFAA